MSKGIMYVDDRRVEFDGEKNVLSVIRKAGISVPTFCYYSELSTYGACRMCVVETDRGTIEASCSMEPKDGLRIYTNTQKTLRYRKMILELLLAAHCRDCTTCEKNGDCKLQELARQFGVRRVRFPDTREPMEKDESSRSIVRDPNKCILCGDCVRVCDEIQGMGIIDFVHRGSKLRVMPAFNRSIAETKCVNCGQCAAVCPTGAITLRNNIGEVWQALQDPGKRVIAQIAPAVRVAIGESFGFAPGDNAMGKLVAAMRRLGFDEVYDTTLGADLTVMEESHEFLERFKKGGPFPMFTSCCPAWVRYVENSNPKYIPHLSSCKSPQQMFGAVIKESQRQISTPDPRETVVVSIMPCAAKKFEAARPEFSRNGVPDVDYVLTTRGLSTMIKEMGIQFSELDEDAPDLPLGMGSGAAVIFGTTGGVAEAVIRRVSGKKTYNLLREIKYSGVRGMDRSVKEAAVQVGDDEIRIAVVHGLKNAQELLKKIERGEVSYHLIEVMACPGGCIGGAGQPFGLSPEKNLRARGLYRADKVAQIKSSEQNPVISALYNGLLSEEAQAHDLLHTHYEDQSR
ncbi:MAG: [FeFe] hydrogenase, group A [Oscillospiraceae bacterium]|nr:4Fe-4S binding protein [Oscillospiraceae bacterium]MCM0704776.1 [FeFe] hydrogenase, group A [Faecalicatena sp. BF-R-105]MDY3217968.1 [FeFe] hydrogenase, group A [Candidatus Fimivivens sp.]SFI60633.1 NADH-quinone oxidoreductase subunit G [Ruminococcaceae bacterium D5]GKH49540.1 ferredoxin [Eubacteriales bacterium]